MKGQRKGSKQKGMRLNNKQNNENETIIPPDRDSLTYEKEIEREKFTKMRRVILRVGAQSGENLRFYKKKYNGKQKDSSMNKTKKKKSKAMLKPAHTYMQQHKTQKMKNIHKQRRADGEGEGAIESRVMSQVKDDGFNDTPVFVSHSPEWFLSKVCKQTIQMHLSKHTNEPKPTSN